MSNKFLFMTFIYASLISISSIISAADSANNSPASFKQVEGFIRTANVFNEKTVEEALAMCATIDEKAEVKFTIDDTELVRIYALIQQKFKKSPHLGTLLAKNFPEATVLTTEERGNDESPFATLFGVPYDESFKKWDIGSQESTNLIQKKKQMVIGVQAKLAQTHSKINETENLLRKLRHEEATDKASLNEHIAYLKSLEAWNRILHIKKSQQHQTLKEKISDLENTIGNLSRSISDFSATMPTEMGAITKNSENQNLLKKYQKELSLLKTDFEKMQKRVDGRNWSSTLNSFVWKS